MDLQILRALSGIEKQTWVLFWNETSSGVMNFKISFYRLANFTGNQTDPVTLFRASTQQDERMLTQHKLGGASNDILYISAPLRSTT